MMRRHVNGRDLRELQRHDIQLFFFPLKSVHEHKVGLRTIFVLKKSEESLYSEKTDG